MSVVSKMLWVLESRWRQPVSLDDLADVTGLSKSYLSRTFALVTGYSVTAYVRARRLSDAARQLAEGAPDILAVALDAGYGSHEAFTRAFCDQFGVTPQRVRRERSLQSIELVEPQRMDLQISTTVEPPRIELRPATRYTGLARRHSMSNPAAIPSQWGQFQPFIGNIDGAVGEAAFGLVGAIDSDDTFEYLVAVEIDPQADAPADLAVVYVPGLRWARFSHHGDLSTLRNTIGAAEQWLRDNGHKPSEAAWSFIEYYGPDFDPRTGSGDVEVWFGLER